MLPDDAPFIPHPVTLSIARLDASGAREAPPLPIARFANGIAAPYLVIPPDHRETVRVRLVMNAITALFERERKMLEGAV